MTEYTSFLADDTADHGRVNDNRRRALDELGRSGEASDADGGGFAAGANQVARREAAKSMPAGSGAPAAEAPPPTTPGDGAVGGRSFGGPTTPAPLPQSGLLKASDSKRDVEELKVGEIRQIANGTFYRRANVQNRATVWVDAEVTDTSKADEVVVRWSPRFFELLASTTADENTRLAQDGDVLLRIGARQVFVTDTAGAK